ncbi:rhomboid family intramembrane serine protease [Mycetocola miduiensis]|uniref:Membrane associated serine protease, rhomboid family n=1 Tax=Mycetocola miduiensis TaxID=995034 RepID=A0A1I4YZZ4_9MICO|nr:rhomboid family intramembrane serine protease [Mycetocola miduiensis]SFN43220.1 Membrane associated serine protease, rhomboid family [Mycetocola miduiensis]
MSQSSVPPVRSGNFCYRHPDRQSFVLCQRCGRTICGECQTPGAVGVICPECMREQRKTTPRARTGFFSRSGDRPLVTYILIAVTAFVFLLQLIPGLGVTQQLLYAGVYSLPSGFYPGYDFEPWRMLTTVFAHSQGFIFHIALNMYSLWLFGQALEPMLGRARFLTLYLISGFAGSLGVSFLAGDFVPVVGASGAIFGLMGAFLVIQRKRGGNMNGLLVLVGINLVIGFIPGINVAWQAHVGGLVGGALAGLIYYETRHLKHKSRQIVLIVALCVVLVALSLVPFVSTFIL